VGASVKREVKVHKLQEKVHKIPKVPKIKGKEAEIDFIPWDEIYGATSSAVRG
jgi:hypothetical protein